MFTRNSIDMNNNFLGFPISNFTNITNVVSQIGKPGNCAANNLCIKSITGKNRMAQEKTCSCQKEEEPNIENTLKPSWKAQQNTLEKKKKCNICAKKLCVYAYAS